MAGHGIKSLTAAVVGAWHGNDLAWHGTIQAAHGEHGGAASEHGGASGGVPLGYGAIPGRRSVIPAPCATGAKCQRECAVGRSDSATPGREGAGYCAVVPGARQEFGMASAVVSG